LDRSRSWRAALVVLAAMLGCVAAPRAEVIDRVVATVGSRTVTLSDVRAALALGLVPADGGGELDQAVVRACTDRVLVALEVERYGGTAPDEAAVTRRVEALTGRLGPGGLAVVMARAGLDEPRLRALLREDLAIEKYLDERFGGAAQPTEDEVQAHYLGHPEAFMRGGSPIPFSEAEPAARQALVEQRKQQLIEGWLEGLRRRTPVDVKVPPAQ
jgi:hypothetical protein